MGGGGKGNTEMDQIRPACIKREFVRSPVRGDQRKGPGNTGPVAAGAWGVGSGRQPSRPGSFHIKQVSVPASHLTSNISVVYSV